MPAVDRGAEHDVGPGPLSSLWRYRGISLVLVVVIAGAAGMMGVLRPPASTAVSRMGLSDPRSLSIFLGAGSSGADLGRYAAAQVRFAESAEVLQAAATALADGTTATTLQSSVTVVAASTSNVLTVTATGGSDGQAVRRADAEVAAYQKLTAQQTRDTVARQLAAINSQRFALSEQIAAAATTTEAGKATLQAATATLATLQQTASAAQNEAALFGSGTDFVDPAQVQAHSSAMSRGVQDGGLGALVALLLAGAVAWIRAGRRREVESADEAAGVLDAPVLGEIARVPGRRQSRGLDDPHQPPELGFHTVATALSAVSPTGLFLIVGQARGDGRTTTTIGLAAALAAGGTRVAIVDADLRTARLTALFDLDDRAAGFAELARGEVGLLDVAHKTSGSAGGDVVVVPAGRPGGEPAGLLRSPSAIEALYRMRSAFDVVLVDTPALGVTSDGLGLSRAASGVIAVVRRRTPTRPLRDLRESVNVNGALIVGLVFTFGAGRRGSYGGYAGPGTSESRGAYRPRHGAGAVQPPPSPPSPVPQSPPPPLPTDSNDVYPVTSGP